ncbi:hypothetical protein N665_0010s0013 [Sinapis alba]|nr:hypothetical protein N665_0010s0013 [Sinapis alba]
MPPKKKKSTSVSPTKKKRATDLVEKKTTCVSPAKKKKATDFVEKNKGKKKESPVKKRKQSQGKRKRDVMAVEKDGGDNRDDDRDSLSIPTKKAYRSNRDQEREPEAPPLHSTPAPTVNETDLAEIEWEPTEPPQNSTAAVTDHEMDRHETERPPPCLTVSSTQVEQPSGSSTRSPSPELKEEEDEEIGSTSAGRPHVQADEDMAVEPIKPNIFFFKPENYWKSFKLQSRCHEHKFMTILELLDESEKKWFLEPPVQALVTHGLHPNEKEHGLILGLYCHQYPENYKSGLSMKFAEKQFRKIFMKKLKNMEKKKKNLEEEELKVTVQDVEEKLSWMKLDLLDGKSKYGSPIDPFLLQVVDDLELCNTFPWGRFTFDHCIKGIKHEISSILAPIEQDMELLDDGDDDDAIVDGWNKLIVREGGKIFWEDIFMEDTKSRTLEIEQQDVEQLEEEEHEAGHEHEAGNEPERILGGEPVANFESLKEMVMRMMSQMTTMEGKINNKLEDFDRKLKVLEGDSIGTENDGDEDDNDDGKDAGKDDEAEDNGEKELEEQEDLDKEHEDEEAEDNGEKAELDDSEKDLE